MKRRQLLLGTAAAAGLAGLGAWSGLSILSQRQPLALVYRGPAAYPECSEAAAALLESTPTRFRVAYCGPDEDIPVSAESLSEAAVYVQPGGGQLRRAWRRMRQHADDIREFVRGGGHYLGFCLGAYLAGSDPGFGLTSGIVIDSYVDSPGSSVTDTADTIVQVHWRGRLRHMYFQDGCRFQIQPEATATVLATYDTGVPAAIIASFGAGRVGLVGPHPEAQRSWYRDAGLVNPDGIRFDLGHDLVESTIREPTPAAES